MTLPSLRDDQDETQTSCQDVFPGLVGKWEHAVQLHNAPHI